MAPRRPPLSQRQAQLRARNSTTKTDGAPFHGADRCIYLPCLRRPPPYITCFSQSENNRFLLPHATPDIRTPRSLVCLYITPSLPQPVKFLAERCMDVPASSIFSIPITHLLSMLCVLMAILSHASVKKKTKKLKGFKIHTFTGCFQVTSWQ